MLANLIGFDSNSWKTIPLDWFDIASRKHDSTLHTTLLESFGGDWPDVVLCADVVWVSDLVSPLANTIDFLTRPEFRPNMAAPYVVMAIYERSLRVEESFFELIRQFGLTIQLLEQSSSNSRMRIFKFHR
jgi:hypothetical protein